MVLWWSSILKAKHGHIHQSKHSHGNLQKTLILKAEHGHVHQRVDYDDLQKTVMPEEWQQNSQKYTVIATFIEMELFDIFLRQ